MYRGGGGWDEKVGGRGGEVRVRYETNGRGAREWEPPDRYLFCTNSDVRFKLWLLILEAPSAIRLLERDLDYDQSVMRF